MKKPSILAILCSICALCATPAVAEPVKARLFYSDGSHDDVYLISFKAGTATYRTNLKSLNILQVKKPKLEAVYFYQPELFSEAMSLYRKKNYEEAKAKFIECEALYREVDSLPDNYATLAGFYKMECSRKSNDLEALKDELEKYFKTGLTRQVHLDQLELYAFWDAVRLKEWDRLDRLAESWQTRKLPSELRVQVEYCHALALDELQKNDPTRLVDALNAYSRVLSADATASIDLVLKAANGLLRIYSEDPAVQLAIKNWKTNDEKKSSAGYQRLMEANTLAHYYKRIGFDAIEPLTSDFAKFLDYGPAKFDTGSDQAPDAAEENAGEASEEVSDEADVPADNDN